ncbi:MAG TPA: ABC transporter permease [Cyclobacteriaceae bacterium]|nr:ABC transporter permease [Cyclobacteriaceae bacterium]
MKRKDLPYLPFAFFRLFCKPEWHAAIEGDLIEHYDRNVDTVGPTKAYWKLILDVLRLFRPGIIRSIHFKNNPIMFRHNILLSLRNFRRYKTSFIINVAGLSTGLACVMLIFLWVNDELSKDRFHVNGDRLYQVLENRVQTGHVITRESNSGRTAEALNTQYPEVDTAIMTTWNWGQSKVLSVTSNGTSKDINIDCLYADEPFFRMFSFPLIEGSASNVLRDMTSVVISKQLAISLFGSPADAVGKTVDIDHASQFQVSGVMEVPEESSRKFDIVINFESFRKANKWLNLWEATAPQTLLMLNEGVDVEEFNRKVANLVRDNSNINVRTPFVRKFSDGYLYGRYEEGKLAGGRIEYVRLFSIIALFILVIACMNFMNLSTARASRRMKEVGIKKAVGARQGSLAAQFLSESTLLSLISSVVSVLMVVLFLPQFNLITDKNLKLDNLLWFIPLVAIVTGLISGSYPAIYLSRFKPALVLKGKLESMTLANMARKWLVVFQFTISIVMITCVLIVYKQIEFVQSRALGYNKNNVMIFSRSGEISKKQDAFIDELRKIPGVITASASSHDMTGHNGGISGITWPGKDPEDRTEFERMHIDRGFVEMMGIELKEGRMFTDNADNEKGNVMFNENAIKYMGLKDPVGKVLDFNGDPHTIIGVVKDFNFESFHEPIKPLYIVMDQRSAGNIMLKIEGGKEQDVVERVTRFHNSFNPGFPFVYRFVDEDYKDQYRAEQRVADLSRYFASLAILISCLGLFGLAAFTAERRVKEIGIRKVLGSGDARIVLLLSEEFMKIMFIALVIAVPASWYLTGSWLEGFQYRIELQWWYFAVSGLAALAIAWLAVSYQTIKASRINPVECLKVE